MPRLVPVYDCDDHLIAKLLPVELEGGGWLDGEVLVVRSRTNKIRRVHLHARYQAETVERDQFESGSGVKPGQKYVHLVSITDGSRKFWQLRSVRSLGAAAYYETVLSGVTRQ